MRERQPEPCDKCGGVGWLPAASTLSRKRRKTGITARVIADFMGISPQYLCDLENGRRAWNYGLVEEFEKAITNATR
jgi:predicted transcriptional regulator